MAGAIKQVRLETATARSRLKRGRQAHWHTLVPGRAHLGWQRWQGDATGRWLLRRYVQRCQYQVTPLGGADDQGSADGQHVLSFAQAEAKARAMLVGGTGKVHRMTVRQAFDQYVAHKEALHQPVADLLSRGRAHILPLLGDLVVEDLDAAQLRRWLATLATVPAQVRPKAGKAQYQAAPRTDEDKRRRKASANRVLTMLKAMLNHAYDEGHVSNQAAWGRKLKPFRDVDVARVRYLTVAEAMRLLNACDQDFRPLVRAALETGCRYSELARLEVHDFNADVGTVTIRKSKTSKARHVVLTKDGKAFFQRHCLGRTGNDLMFTHEDGNGWKASEQGRLMDGANEAAKLKPPITFHGLRHTWASLSVMNHTPLLVVAKNLGHTDTRMVEKHYGHLAPSFIADAIRAGAPRFGAVDSKRVVPLR
jgi:integrase